MTETAKELELSPYSKGRCFKSLEEVHNLSDIIGEIDDLVLQHSQKEFNDYSEDSENEAAKNVEKPVTVMDQTASNAAKVLEAIAAEAQNSILKEKENAAVHFRGISFGVAAGPSREECDLASKHNSETADSRSSEANARYIRVLEENNEVLKNSNEALLRVLKEKDDMVNSLKTQNDALRKQNVFVAKKYMKTLGNIKGKVAKGRRRE